MKIIKSFKYYFLYYIIDYYKMSAIAKIIFTKIIKKDGEEETIMIMTV